MSIIQPEFEYVDRATETIRYLEHGWPTDLCRWHSHAEYELHLIVATRGKTFVGDYIGEFKPGSLYLVGSHLPHNWITDEVANPEPVETRDMLVQFSQESVDQRALAFPEFRKMEAMFELSKSGIEFTGFNPTFAHGHLERIRNTRGAERIIVFLRFLIRVNEHAEKRPLSIVGMSSTDFSLNFQSITGKKFVEFVNRVRISQACSMLYSTDDQISTVCFEVGFQNIANFNRHFPKMKGMTSKEFRETALRELAPEGKATA